MTLPQGLFFNALCFLTEQIHQVAVPYQHLDELLEDVAKLSFTIENPGPVIASVTAQAAAPTQPARGGGGGGGRKSTTRTTQVQGASSSPAASRRLRNTASRAQETNTNVGIDRGVLYEYGRDAAKRLAQKLRGNIDSEVVNMQIERFEALATSMDDFKALLGNFENVRLVCSVHQQLVC